MGTDRLTAQNGLPNMMNTINGAYDSPDAESRRHTRKPAARSRNAPAWVVIILLAAQSVLILALRDPRQYIFVLPILCADILVTRVPLRVFLKALRGLVLGSAVFALAALLTNQNGRELAAGFIYSEGLTEAILLTLQFTLLGLASQASLYRFGQGAALRALAILLSPLRVFGISGGAAARVFYRAFGLMPLILPRIMEMLKNRNLNMRALLGINGSKTRSGVPVRRHTNTNHRLLIQLGVCLLWLGCAIVIMSGLAETIADSL